MPEEGPSVDVAIMPGVSTVSFSIESILGRSDFSIDSILQRSPVYNPRHTGLYPSSDDAPPTNGGLRDDGPSQPHQGEDPPQQEERPQGEAGALRDEGPSRPHQGVDTPPQEEKGEARALGKKRSSRVGRPSRQRSPKDKEVPNLRQHRSDRKPRAPFQPYQLEALERKYRASPYLLTQHRPELARSIALTELQVKVWFQNRRAKERRLRESFPPVLLQPLYHFYPPLPPPVWYCGYHPTCR